MKFGDLFIAVAIGLGVGVMCAVPVALIGYLLYVAQRCAL